jgi:hypothetical protein
MAERICPEYFNVTSIPLMPVRRTPGRHAPPIFVQTTQASLPPTYEHLSEDLNERRTPSPGGVSHQSLVAAPDFNSTPSSPHAKSPDKLSHLAYQNDSHFEHQYAHLTPHLAVEDRLPPMPAYGTTQWDHMGAFPGNQELRWPDDPSLYGRGAGRTNHF